jgi:Ser/Thr protein kinase RdoA (MazF antagonist)
MQAMTFAAKAHGMNGALVDADWPPLSLDEVQALLCGFSGCGEPTEILSVSPRPFSAASVVATQSGKIFIKRHHRDVRDAEGLREEHRFMAHLRAHGASVPRVFANDCGETAITRGEWSYEVHEAPVGVDLYEDALSWTPFHSAAHARSAGAALAQLHLASQGFDAPQRKPRPLVASFMIFAGGDPDAAMQRYLTARPALLDDAETLCACGESMDLLTPFYAQLKPLLPALKPLWTHNDFHASNLLWSDGSNAAQASAVIDFGLADRTNAVCDLAQAIERNIIEWLELTRGAEDAQEIPVHFDHLSALLEGYQSQRPLTAQESAALAPMTALCHAEFALSEADYFLGVLGSREKTRMATLDYLVGHARWFHGASGKRLLDALLMWSGGRKKRGIAQ